jgi:hypothetical protein
MEDRQFTVTLKGGVFINMKDAPPVLSDTIYCAAYDRDPVGFTFYEDAGKTDFIAFIVNDHVLAVVKNN